MSTPTTKSTQKLIDELHQAYLNGLLTYTMSRTNDSRRATIFRILFDHKRSSGDALKKLSKYIEQQFPSVQRVDVFPDIAFSEIHVICDSSKKTDK